MNSYIRVESKKQKTMGIIKDKRKFERTKEKDIPVNPSGSPSKTKTNKFDIKETSIKKKQSKQ